MCNKLIKNMVVMSPYKHILFLFLKCELYLNQLKYKNI
jgi:hypothetical protein